MLPSATREARSSGACSLMKFDDAPAAPAKSITEVWRSCWPSEPPNCASCLMSVPVKTPAAPAPQEETTPLQDYATYEATKDISDPNTAAVAGAAAAQVAGALQ